MKRIDLWKQSGVLVAVFAVSLCMPGCADDRLGEGSWEQQSLAFDGLTRSYKLYSPTAAASLGELPLIVAIHGLSQSPDDLARLTGFNLEADRRGLHVVYPAAHAGNWNDLRDVDGVPAYDLDVDDTGFIRAVVAQVVATRDVDTSRIYAAGMSNGGMMVYRLAFQAPDLFAGFAAVVASIPVNQTTSYTPGGPVNMWISAGDADPILPYDGGEVMGELKSLGVMLSVPDSIGYWVAANGCNPDPVITTLPNRESPNRTIVQHAVYAGCDDGGDVEVYGVEGGGHTWPGGPAREATRAQGPISEDFDATSVIVDFFLAHVKSGKD